MSGMGEKEKVLMAYIEDSVELWSLLFDLDLLPEQVTRLSGEWKRMIILADWHWHMENFKDKQ